MTRVKRHSTSDLMDDWLESQGYYRKHTARDGSCLFRAVSEQVFHTQVFHLEVRTACIDYMKRHRDKFVEFIEGSFDNHLNNLQNPKEWAGQVEMCAMSSLFNRDFLVFSEVGKNPYNVTDHGCQEKIMLYFSQGNHYDSVYLRNFIANAASCQSLIYEILYKRVFRMGDEVDLAVEKMLHDKAYAKLRKDSTASMDSNCGVPDYVLDLEEESSRECNEKDCGSEIRRALAQGFPPFPYKVAKALDAEIYRNVEFDVWNEAKKDETVFEPGVKCLVRLEKNESEVYHAHIQEMSPDKGPVTVYIVELGKKQTVDYKNLEPLPLAYNKASWQTVGKSYKTFTTYYNKPHVSGTMLEMDKYKGKKKLFKKSKFKQDIPFPLPLSCSHGLPPRLQPQQSNYEPSVVPVGRGVSYQSGPRNPGPHVKWLSPVLQNQRYRPRNNGGRGYYVPPVNGTQENQNQVFENKTAYDQKESNSSPSLQKSNSASTTVTWVKSIGSVASTAPPYQPAPVTASHLNNNNNAGMCTSFSNNEAPLPAPPVVPLQVTSSVPPLTKGSMPEVIPMQYPPSTSISHGAIPLNIPSTPPHSSPVVQTLSHSPLLPQSYIASPQPMSIYPCQYYQGVYVPMESTVQPVNYSAPRSQDPNGADLPLQDLATLRYFFNLGCDYFRGALIPVPPATQYTMWNYGNQVAYPTINGFLTPVSSTDGCESMEDPSSSSATGLSPVESATEADRGPFENMYEPTYIYGSSSPVSFMPTAMYQPLDYCTPIPNMVGDFKSGLVLNEQGVLSLNSASPPIQAARTPTRHRSDSCGSTHSQCSNQEWNHRKPHPCNAANGTSNASETQCVGYKGATSFFRHPSPRGGASGHLPPRFQRRNSSPHKQPTSPYRSQPLMQMGMTPGQSPFPIVPVCSPMMAASPPTIGPYTNSNPSNTTIVAQAPYFNPTPPAGVMYPSGHPQHVSFVPAPAQ